MSKADEITPIDYNACQAEKPNGASFMTMGGVPKQIRCTNKPNVIATETEKGEDGIQGSMSLCNECLEVAKKQLPPNFFIITPI